MDRQALFCQNVVFLWRRKGRKVNELERTINASQGYLSRVVNGDGNITLERALILADLVGQTVDDLCNRDFEREIRIDELRRELERWEKEASE